MLAWSHPHLPLFVQPHDMALVRDPSGGDRFPSLRGRDWHNASNQHAHEFLHNFLKNLKNAKSEEQYRSWVFQHVVRASDQQLDNLVRKQIPATLRSEKENEEGMNAQMHAEWERIVAFAQFDKLALPKCGRRHQTMCDTAQEEAEGSLVREAKDLVAVLQASIPSQSTLANQARSSSGIDSEECAEKQASHADAQFNIDAPSQNESHALWNNALIVSLQAILHPTDITMIAGSHKLMKVRPPTSCPKFC